LDRNAYIHVILSNKNFCASAKAAFKLMKKALGKFLVVYSVDGYILGIAKLLIALMTTLVGSGLLYATTDF
jgi:hypothetical protein